jgi:hypothetical protein
MLWTCLHFSDLPLRIFARAGMREIPSVVSTASHRPDVLVANGAAQKRGIVSGMSIAAALALDPDVAIHLRDERAEAAALKNIALWAGQWTSTIAIEPPANVLLEISGCLNYFGGLGTLLGRIEAGLAAIGFSAVVATAPTASAASLLARAGRAIAIEEGAGTSVAQAGRANAMEKGADIDSALSSLPVGLLEGADQVMDTLWGIGVRTRPDRSRARQPARCEGAVRGAGALSRPARAACAGP